MPIVSNAPELTEIPIRRRTPDEMRELASTLLAQADEREEQIYAAQGQRVIRTEVGCAVSDTGRYRLVIQTEYKTGKTRVIPQPEQWHFRNMKGKMVVNTTEEQPLRERWGDKDFSHERLGLFTIAHIGYDANGNKTALFVEVNGER